MSVFWKPKEYTWNLLLRTNTWTNVIQFLSMGLIKQDTVFTWSPVAKKFTGVIAPHKRKNLEPLEVHSKISKVDESSSGPVFFPRICFFCKAWKRYFNRKRTVPHAITTTDAVKRISEVAEMKKDEELVLNIRGVDLIANDFMMHMKCYKDYIRVLSQSADDEKECSREVGDFNVQCCKKLHSKSSSLQ